MAIISGGKERTGGKGSVFLFSGRYVFGAEKGMSEASKKRPVFRALSGCFCFLKRRTICSAEQQLQRQSLLLFSGCRTAIRCPVGRLASSHRSSPFSGGTIVLFHAHPPAFYIHPNIRYFQTYSCEIPSAFFPAFIIP